MTMKTLSSILGALALCLAAQAAKVPRCKHCPQDACMEAIIKTECGNYLFVEETAAAGLETAVETLTVAITPSVVSSVIYTKTVINDVTTIIPILATETIDYTVTITEPATATNTVVQVEAVTVTAAPAVTPRKRDTDASGPQWDVPEYAADACSDISQYASHCSCLGFKASTRTVTLDAATTTSTVTSTLTGDASVALSTVSTVLLTEIGTTVSLTTTVSTVTESRAVQTDILTQTVATTDLTQTSTTTSTVTPTLPAPEVTHTVQLTTGTQGEFLEDINVPPGAEIGVIATVRMTALPATVAIKPDGSVQLLKTPMTTVPYELYIYERNAAFSYVQLTTARVAAIIGVQKLSCRLGARNEVTCSRQGEVGALRLCGRHLALVWGAEGEAAFERSCVNGFRSISLTGIAV